MIGRCCLKIIAGGHGSCSIMQVNRWLRKCLCYNSRMSESVLCIVVKNIALGCFMG